ncbi:MAG: hypothetical protein IJU90_00185 [Bacteroidales bacterium]|nr:hypothetical protein [Bacteroidales bacterium]
MALFRRRYKGTAMAMRWHRQRMTFRWCVFAFVLLSVSVTSYAFISNSGVFPRLFNYHVAGVEQETNVYRRLVRTHIPPINVSGYRRGDFVDLLPDINDVQLESAQRWGVCPPIQASGIESNEQLVQIKSNGLYVVDTLTHSMPYLVPAAALLLQYIGERFAEVMSERNHDGHTYRPIVTSVLRTSSDVRNLVRSNRNATENSCHCYGTTFDITYGRFLRDDGEEIQEFWLRDILAIVLYELRYEGLCYVRFEVHQPCMHITVRDIEYKGNLPFTEQTVMLNSDVEMVEIAKPEPSPTPAPTNNQSDNYLIF